MSNVFAYWTRAALGSVDDPSVYLAFLQAGGQVGVVSNSGVNWQATLPVLIPDARID